MSLAPSEPRAQISCEDGPKRYAGIEVKQGIGSLGKFTPPFGFGKRNTTLPLSKFNKSSMLTTINFEQMKEPDTVL